VVINYQAGARDVYAGLYFASGSYLKTRREVAIARPRIIAEVQAGYIGVVQQRVFQGVSRQLKNAKQRTINYIYTEPVK